MNTIRKVVSVLRYLMPLFILNFAIWAQPQSKQKKPTLQITSIEIGDSKALIYFSILPEVREKISKLVCYRKISKERRFKK